ncbi:MAG: DUF58 domain-containing protein [Polyangiales bacterium]
MISRETLKKLRRIEIRTARLANEQLAGSYHSVFKGRGMAFSEVRQYQPGDDVRFIDWNVSARSDDTYVKLFTEEREMTVILLVDLSASQRFGSAARPKLETAAEVAALLAFSAIKNNDRVGLILFTDRVEKFVPPKKGKGHVLHVVTEILEAKPTHTGTNLTEALTLLGNISRRRAVAFLVSDFLAQGYEQALRLAGKRHDLIPLTILDPREEQLPDVGIALFEDLESGQLVEVDTGDARVRQAYQMAATRERMKREQAFKRLKLDGVTIRTDRSYVEPISSLFRLRQKRMRGFG